MEPSRKLARAAGLCYFATHITSIGGLALYGPVLNDPDYVLGAGADGPVLLGALLEVLLALGIVGTAVTLYPVTRRHNEAVAAGYTALRVLEAAVIAVGIVSLLAVVTLRRHGADGADPAALATTARALVAVHDWTFLLGPNFVCGANTLLAAYLMYRSRLVPRVVAVLGLVGGPLIFASAVAVLFGVYGQVSAWGALAAVPVFAWELALATCLVTRGFDRAAVAAPAAA
ncbi:DUF4386 domain-containing protein [Kitasatospora sp. DSM 101779]|uniref:DUF4386 domain-containing protein n=1 Tax=Kitasatospora sp. DSM 101779 TaxID=2853165 RepID=UPI0021D834E8|nr:DUF4386 domain-containing protein [Kitasatospora sp. DSM 101779]MCU7823911.1 DUF4386 domain-containing protein [Kitasatospora sp. DSM 101779]